MTKENNAGTGAPIDGTAGKLIADMAVKSSVADIVKIDTKGLGAGLPQVVPALFNRDKQSLVSVAPVIEDMRQLPARARGTATALTRDSFIDLVNRHKDADSVVFAKTIGIEPTMTAVFDYHKIEAGKPRWGQHRAHYAFPVSDEMKAWVGQNGQKMEQLEFAHFLEDHAAELASPTDGEKSEFERLFRERFAAPSELLALSRGLEIFVGAKIKRQERLQTGERVIEFDEQHSDAEGNRVDIPGIFMVSVPAFVDGSPVRIPARLRYRAGAGGVSWFYQLYRWEVWLRDRVKDDLAIVGKATELPTFEGAPEGVRLAAS